MYDDASCNSEPKHELESTSTIFKHCLPPRTKIRIFEHQSSKSWCKLRRVVQLGNSLSSAPALVLDEECVMERDFSNCAMGRVKSFDSITKILRDPTLYAVLGKSFDKIGNQWEKCLTMKDSYETSFGPNNDFSSAGLISSRIKGTHVHLEREISADPFGLTDLLGLKKPVEENLEPSPSCHTPRVSMKKCPFNSEGGSGNNKGDLFWTSYLTVLEAFGSFSTWCTWIRDDSLWFRVIQAVSWDKMILIHRFRKVSIWSSILKEVQVLKSSGFDFLSYCSKRIGDGQSTSFWKETWMGDIPFVVVSAFVCP
ncbi:hypothetical protein Tco_0701517 [Tanacetum coccineum]